jgi:uncharacterized protein YciI
MAFHVQLARGYFARTHLFNLTADQLRATVLRPFSEDRVVMIEDVRWPPAETKLLIYEGPELATEQLALNQGWRNATRSGTDVTKAWLAGPPAAAAAETRPAGVIAPGKRLILLYDYVGEMRERRAPHREAHLALVRRWRDEGRLAVAGALGDPPHGAALVFNAEDPREVERFVSEDPYVAAELVTAWRVEPWNVVG